MKKRTKITAEEQKDNDLPSVDSHSSSESSEQDNSAMPEENSTSSETTNHSDTSNTTPSQQKPEETSLENAEPAAMTSKTKDSKSKSKNKSAANTDKPVEKKTSTKSAKLALLLAIIALIISGYLYYQFRLNSHHQQQTINTVDNLKNELASSANNANKIANDLKSEVDKTLASVNSNLKQLQQTAAQKSADIAELQDRLTKSIQQVEASTAQTNSRKDWLLAEVEYLLRLANQRVLMENTPIGALALLKSADKILQQTDDVSIFAVRKALLSDITALETVPVIDQEGLYLTIDALSEQIDNLRLVPVTDKNKLPSLLDEVAGDAVNSANDSSLANIWNSASEKLGKLVIIQHRDKAIDPLLSSAQQANLLQNLHILFEQSQLALLQRKQLAYERSLTKAENIITRYFQADDSTTIALVKGIIKLKKEHITADIPSIATSLNSLKAYLKQSAEIKSNVGNIEGNQQ